MNGHSADLVRAITGPVILIALGVLFAFDRFTNFHFNQSWPILLIVFGLAGAFGPAARPAFVRPRSLTGPIILILIGLLFLIHNLRPYLIQLSRIGDYWPFLLIAAGIVGLIEVLYYAAHGATAPPRPFGRGLIFWAIVLCILLAIAGRNRANRFPRIDFENDGAGLLGSDYDYNVNAAEPAQGIKRIVLDDLSGNLSLKGGESEEIRVTGHETVRAFNRRAADRAHSTSALHLVRNGDDLMIVMRSDRARGFVPVSADVEIAVPKMIAIESRGRTGDLAVDDLDGAIDLSSGRGDIRLNHVAGARIGQWRSGDIHANDVMGSIDIDGRGSDIRLENIAGPVTIKGEFSGDLAFRALAKPLEFTSSHTTFNVEAIPGEITMDLGDLNIANAAGPVRFDSGTRDISATDVTTAMELTVDRGDITFTATQPPPPKIDIHTRDGDIALTLPAAARFEIDGSTANGEISSAFASLRVDSTGTSATVKGRTGSGPMVNLVTDRGNISIEKR